MPGQRARYGERFSLEIRNSPEIRIAKFSISKGLSEFTRKVRNLRAESSDFALILKPFQEVIFHEQENDCPYPRAV